MVEYYRKVRFYTRGNCGYTLLKKYDWIPPKKATDVIGKSIISNIFLTLFVF